MSISVTVSCAIKTFQVNLNTVFYVVNIDFLEKCAETKIGLFKILCTDHSIRISFLNF